MVRASQPDEKVIEVWQATTEGTIWVWIYDRREDKYTKQRVGGRGGSKKLHISRDDRRFNQEQVVDEMRGEHDVFVNGALRLVSADKAEDIDATYHLTDSDLAEMLEVTDMDVFQDAVLDVKSELLLRRLKDAGGSKATVAQLEFIQAVIDERYKVGGTQRTVAEMLAEDDATGTRLS